MVAEQEAAEELRKHYREQYPEIEDSEIQTGIDLNRSVWQDPSFENMDAVRDYNIKLIKKYKPEVAEQMKKEMKME